MENYWIIEIQQLFSIFKLITHTLMLTFAFNFEAFYLISISFKSLKLMCVFVFCSNILPISLLGWLYPSECMVSNCYHLKA